MDGNKEVCFIFQRKSYTVQSKVTESLETTFKKFVNLINPSFVPEEFDFYYEGSKLNDGQKIFKDVITETKNINITAERKLRIIKCPECICNDCIINLEDYQINFYGCKYNHRTTKLLNQCVGSQNVDFSQIICSQEDCKENMSKSFQDYYKCLTCTKLVGHTFYLCNNHYSHQGHEKHVKVKYDHKNYYCENHYHEFLEYCFKCNLNLCHDCLKDHKGYKHLVKNYSSLLPNLKEIKENLCKIKTKIGDLGIVIQSIKKAFDGVMKMFDNYYMIANDIVEKYELYNKEYKNYRILRSLLNLKKSNKTILKDLEDIINEKNIKKKASKLIGIFKTDMDIYNNAKTKKNSINDEEYNDWEKEKAVK